MGLSGLTGKYFYPLNHLTGPVSLFLILSILMNMYGCLVVVLVYIFLVRNNTEHHFVCLLAIHNSYSFW